MPSCHNHTDSPEAVAAFVREYARGTLPELSVPGNRYLRGQPLVFFNLAAVQGQLWLHFVGSRDPGKGHGGRGLRWLCDLADRHGVHLHLAVFRPPDLDRRYLSTEALQAWYGRHGFRPALGRRKNVMVRCPDAGAEPPA